MKTIMMAALATVITCGVALAGPNGSEDSPPTQGNSGQPANTKSSDSSNGTQTMTTTGPAGALKNDKTTPNQETTTSGPGNSNK
jgi:hypothetical protein